MKNKNAVKPRRLRVVDKKPSKLLIRELRRCMESNDKAIRHAAVALLLALVGSLGS